MRRTDLSSRSGVSLIEMLVAIAIVMTFLAGTTLAFIEIMRANERAETRLDAIANARTALDSMSLEIKRARFGPPSDPVSSATIFQGWTINGLAGDRYDDDGDGSVDEEFFGGDLINPDEDNDWVLATDDKHATVSDYFTVYERPYYKGYADKGDTRVDEDVKFTSAGVLLRTFPLPGESGDRDVHFYLGEFDGEPNVLLRAITRPDPGSSPPTSTTVVGPLAHNVLSFGALFWDPVVAQRSTTGTVENAWTNYWSAEEKATTGAMTMPPSVYLSVTVFAGSPLPLSQIPVTEPLNTVTLDTMVNIEAVLHDPMYSAMRPEDITSGTVAITP